MDANPSFSSKHLRGALYGLAGAGLIGAGIFGQWPDRELRAQTYSEPADLALSASASAEVVGPGSAFHIQYEVSNAGPGVAHGVVLVASHGPKASTVATSGCLEDPAPGPWCTVALPGGQLNPGQSATVVVNFQVGARVPDGGFVVEGVVSATESDPNPGNEYNSTMMTVDGPW